MKRKLIRRGDLPDLPPPNVVLYCQMCSASYSATRSDYFFCGNGQIMNCEGCSRPLQLVERVVVYRQPMFRGSKGKGSRVAVTTGTRGRKE